MLEKICLMLVKSKQQLVREKLLLKPRKGSVALREELKGKISKASGSTAKQTTSTVPSVIVKLRDNFESPGNVTCCLREILQQPSKREILLSLSGKELTKNCCWHWGSLDLKARRKPNRLRSCCRQVMNVLSSTLTM